MPMSVRCFVRTTPISRASATARSLTDGFEPPGSRIRSARSRSRLRTLIEGSGVAWRGIRQHKVRSFPGSQAFRSVGQVVLPLSAGRRGRIRVGRHRSPPRGMGAPTLRGHSVAWNIASNGSPVREAIDALKPRIPDAKAWDLSRGLRPGRLSFCRCLIWLVGRILARVLADAGLPSAPASLCIWE